LELANHYCEIIQPPIREGIIGDPNQILTESFQNPLGRGPLSEDLTGKSIAIAINDQTRPLPYDEILEPFIAHLVSMKANPERISFFIATGTHKPLSEKEITRLLPGNIISTYPVMCHDCDQTDNLIYIGQTTAGTPVFVNKQYYKADIRVVIGNIEPHHFMGYSGGMKTAAIGLVGRETITKNHAMLSHPKAKKGLFRSNPMRMDVEEIGRLMGIHFAFNIVMDSNKRIMSAFFGEPGAVIRAGIAYYQDHFQMELDDHFSRYELVIASPGGYPKDINLYQAQKALTHACLFAKKGGTIILAAECRDGYGSQPFEAFLSEYSSTQEIISAFESMPFRIGPHKAFQFAQQARDHRIFLVSEIKDTEDIRGLITPFDNIGTALSHAFSELPKASKIAVLPDATHVLPRMNDL